MAQPGRACIEVLPVLAGVAAGVLVMIVVPGLATVSTCSGPSA